MKFVSIIITMLLTVTASSQSMDYNTESGYIAEGYDVVSYFDNMAEKGRKEFTIEIDGANYKFASKENLETFTANPTQYMPQYGGYCAYAIAGNKKVTIDPESFQIMDGKLYLFYDSFFAHTLKSWNEEGPKKLRKKADENWKSIMKKG